MANGDLRYGILQKSIRTFPVVVVFATTVPKLHMTQINGNQLAAGAHHAQNLQQHPGYVALGAMCFLVLSWSKVNISFWTVLDRLDQMVRGLGVYKCAKPNAISLRLEMDCTIPLFSESHFWLILQAEGSTGFSLSLGTAQMDSDG